MTVFVSKADVVSTNPKGILGVVFEKGCFYIIWEDKTVSQYQYNWIANHPDIKILEKDYTDVIEGISDELTEG